MVCFCCLCLGNVLLSVFRYMFMFVFVIWCVLNVLLSVFIWFIYGVF